MERVVVVGQRAARSGLPVLVEGEAGVGKEMLARAIHDASPRRSRPFGVIDSGAIPAGLLEAVLAGDGEPVVRRPNGAGSMVPEAHGGTLFLDEIGALPAAAQERLVGILRGREQDRRMGGRLRPNDVRVIAATERRLVDLVSEGRFREDLFQLLNVLTIWIPPLRERRSDVPELLRSMVNRLAAEQGRTADFRISPAAVDLLVAYDWPGNLRQLENAIRIAAILCDGAEIAPEHFPKILAGFAAGGAKKPTNGAPARPTGVPDSGVAIARQVEAERTAMPGARPDRSGPARYGVVRLLDERGELRPFDALEAEVIRFAVGHYRGHMSEVARRLGIGRSTLYRKLKDYGIAPGEAAVP
jgi:DNA-binding NtrC family response regulator